MTDSQKPESGHLPRLLNEQMGQVMVAGVGFLDRLVLMGLLQRVWGDALFSQWSTMLAFAGFGSLFEFGFNLYYNNRITFETERGDRAQAERTLAEANSVFLICSLLGFAVLAAMALVTGVAGSSDSPDSFLATVALLAAACGRLSNVGVIALYRANRNYARYAFITAGSDLLRILVTAIAVLAAADLLTTACLALLAQLLTPILFLFVDSRRRFAPHRLRFALPRGSSLKEAMAMSTAYFMQMLPVVVWSSAPGVILERMDLEARALASFFLIRTLANLARTPLQMFGIVIGQECGRRIAVADTAGAMAALTGGARLFAVLSGIACALVAFAGGPILYLQTGDAGLFSQPLAIAAMAPMLLGAVAVLAHNVLVASNAPYLAMIARWVQVAVTVIVWFACQDLGMAMAMMVALAAGEIAGYLPVAYHAVARLIPLAGPLFFVRFTLLTLLSAALAALICIFCFRLTGDQGVGPILLALAMTGAISSVLVLVMGVDRTTRMRIVDSLSARMFGRRT